MPDIRTTKPAKRPTARSRLTNGSQLLPGADQRSTWARRFRDLVEAFSGECGGNASSPSREALIRRAATLSVELELAESNFANAGRADPAALSAYQTHTNALRRLLETLGIVKNAPIEAYADAPGDIDLRRLALGLLATGSIGLPDEAGGGPNGAISHTHTPLPHKNQKSAEIDLSENFQKKSEPEDREPDPHLVANNIPSPGQYERVGGDDGAWIECSEVRNQRGKWSVYSPAGVHLATKWDRDTAREAARQFNETGTISV